MGPVETNLRHYVKSYKNVVYGSEYLSLWFVGQIEIRLIGDQK